MFDKTSVETILSNTTNLVDFLMMENRGNLVTLEGKTLGGDKARLCIYSKQIIQLIEYLQNNQTSVFYLKGLNADKTGTIYHPIGEFRADMKLEEIIKLIE